MSTARTFRASGPATEDLSAGAEQFTVSGGDWDDVVARIAERDEADRLRNDRIVLNMGPVHPSTHGVLRLVLEADGEVVTEVRVGTGYLHTGIEKNMEYRTWVQGETFVTRMDYVAPFFQEVGYALAVEKLLGITDDVPEKATVTRVLLMELNRIASHVVAVGTGGNEMGGTTLMTIAFRCRENILKAFEMVSGLRMNHAYVRPGGLAQDVPEGFSDFVRSVMPDIKNDVGELGALLLANPILRARFIGVGEIDLAGARQVRQSMPTAQLVFVMPPSWDELVARLVGRGTEDAGEQRRRLLTARAEMDAAGEFDHIIVNDTVARATDELENLLGLKG